MLPWMPQATRAESAAPVTPAMARGPGAILLYDAGLLDPAPAPDLLARLRAAASAGEPGEASSRAHRGRGEVWFLRLGAVECALRHYRRGGLAGRLLRDLYPWAGEERSRPFREWRMLARLRALRLPVPRPIAAACYRRGACYRADLATERIADALPLSARLAAGESVDWAAIGGTLRAFHEAGAWHADLNAHNILIDAVQTAWLLDFDRGRFRPPGQWGARNLARLKRSLHKIAAEPGGPAFDPVGWAELEKGYEAGRDFFLRASDP